jgi:catalase
MKQTLLALAAAGLGALLAPAAHAQASPAEAQVNALEGLFGKQAGSRRSGAKGLCASGYFVGNTVGRNLSSAAVFSGAKVPVIARFSVGGGSPKASDKGRSVRGLALQFDLPGGEQWQTANVSAPVFFVARPEQFAPFMMARTADPATGKPDPAKLKAFNDANPETTRQGAYLAKAPVPASYAAVNYWSTNAFELVGAKGASQFVRWQFVPEAGTLGLSDEQLKSMPDEFLADELRKRVAAAPAVFDFKLQLAEAGDNLTDPTVTWPDSRVVVPAGRLVIDKVEPAAGGACERITFNPLVLPAGIKPSADPVLLARPAPYAISLGRRLSEGAK